MLGHPLKTAPVSVFPSRECLGRAGTSPTSDGRISAARNASHKNDGARCGDRFHTALVHLETRGASGPEEVESWREEVDEARTPGFW